MTHLVIDGMNLIGSRAGGWWRDPDRAIRELVEELEGFAQATGEAITLVFDRRPPGYSPGTGGGLKVLFAGGGPQAADLLIADLVREHPDPDTLLVVTSDKPLRATVEAAGASAESVGAFRERLEDR